MVDVEKGYSLRRQFSRREQKAEVIKEIVDLIDDAIFIGGIAYIAHMLDVIKDPKKLRYQKDIDFFTKDRDKAIKILEARGYDKRSEPIIEGVEITDKYAKYDTQRRKIIGKRELKIPEEKKDGILIYEVPVGVGVDIISRNYYSGSFPNPEYAIESLIKNSTEKNFFGDKIVVQGVDDLLAMKLLNMERAYKGKEKIIYNRDAYDVLNIVNYLENKIDVNHLKKLVGSKDVLKERLEKIVKEVYRPESEVDETLAKLIQVQEIENLDANIYLSIGYKEDELNKLREIIQRL
ncbi:MAG: nucleotidyl transferase AbiEii/AbiGii toxin family protein [Candidatus Aenigmarchaeota archaeon]|nr:nucleotidyl transferase AbiEii/AbiGii toxin family protein [Candidatus Aenigmarchaeota archaeon]